MMRVLLLGFVLLMGCSAYSEYFSGSTDNELDWEGAIADEETAAFAPKAKSSASGSASSQPAARKVPEYLPVPYSKELKKLFAPDQGARQLPASVKQMLLVTASPTTAPTRQRIIEVLCLGNRMQVRIRKDLFSSKQACNHLKFGTCAVNGYTKEHYYFNYLLKSDCGFQFKSTKDGLSVNITLHYKPPGVIMRSLPFDVPLHCSYHRTFHSYAVGFHPTLQGMLVKRLRSSMANVTLVTLIPQDVSGKEINGTKSYTMGQPMYFEAKLSDTASKLHDKRRLYINKCFITPTPDANSPQNFTVIDNHGCMIDGKITDHSKFSTHTSKMTQKFRIGAFLFKDMLSSATPKQLYMHCELAVGDTDPTRTLKACNYDLATGKWTALYGPDSLCQCCENTNSCSSAQPKASSSSRTTDEAVDGRSDEAGSEMQNNQDFLKDWEGY